MSHLVLWLSHFVSPFVVSWALFIMNALLRGGTFQRRVKQALPWLFGFLQGDLSLVSPLPLSPCLLMGTAASSLLTLCIWERAWNTL